MKKSKILAGVFAAMIVASVSAVSLTGCGSSSTTSSSSSEAASTTVSESVSSTAAADAPDDAAGFQEYNIFTEEQDNDFIHMNAVYFQAVPMTGKGYSDISKYNIHIEADVSANENDLGFGTGDWIPYLTVDYKITDKDGKTVAEGNLMPMSASDGPHYGANINLDPGTYDITFSVSADEESYLIHTDSETGPGGTFAEHFKDGKLEFTQKDWVFEGLDA